MKSSPFSISNRRLKKTIADLLKGDDLTSALDTIGRFPPRRAVNPLFSLLLHPSELLRWRAVTAMGAVVDLLAQSNLESARVVMRRMLWMLNDESGGIGWGIPEAMGETMARNATLASEYARMLISYCQPAGNYLEHPVLQRGVVWGLGRLAHARPAAAKGGGGLLLPYLHSPDAVLRGTAVWAAGAFPDGQLRDLLWILTRDSADLRIYLDQQLHDRTVADLAREALRIDETKRR